VRTIANNYSDLKPFKVQALLTAAAERARVPLLLSSTVIVNARHVPNEK